MDAKRIQEIRVELVDLINLQFTVVETHDCFSPEQLEAFALRRRKIDVLLAELDVLAARSRTESDKR